MTPATRARALTVSLESDVSSRFADAQRGRRLHLHPRRGLHRIRFIHLRRQRRHVGQRSGNGDVERVEQCARGTPNLYHVKHNTALSIPAGRGVLANDGDDPGETLTATLLTLPTHGSVSFGTDGSFTYTPAPGFVGTDSFTYSVSDGARTQPGRWV